MTMNGKNTKLFIAALTRAEALQKALRHGCMSADHLFCACVEAAFSDSAPLEERLELEKLVKVYTVLEAGQTSALPDALAKTKAGSPKDFIHLQQMLFAAREKSRSALSAKDAFLAILQAPTPFIASFLRPDAQKTIAAGVGTAAIASIIEKTKRIRKTLLENVFGQEHAVRDFVQGFFQAELQAISNPKRYRPRATFLFAGKPGVGKTFLAERAASALGLPFCRFDMSEYGYEGANLEFSGSDPVYKNGKSGNMTGFVAKHPHCVLLFDEIEKAHRSIIHLFLQILDAGRLRDSYTDQEVSFRDVILIFTTNAGRQLYENADGGELSRQVVMEALGTDRDPFTGEPHFPPAICSRFASGNVVMFRALSAHVLLQIALRELEESRKRFTETFGIEIEIDPGVSSALLFAEGSHGDARSMRRRANAFFADELYEFFRLLGAKTGKAMTLERISISVETPKDPRLAALFGGGESQEILVFAGREVAMPALAGGVLQTDRRAQGEKWLKERMPAFVLVDLACGLEQGWQSPMNLEDIQSQGRLFLDLVRRKYPQVPVYLLDTPALDFDAEALMTFTTTGVWDVLVQDRWLAERLRQIKRQIFQQRCVEGLGRSSRALRYGTAQTISPDGREARILLYDFRVVRDVIAADRARFLRQEQSVTFADVIGLEEAKMELQEALLALKQPAALRQAGLRPPRGLLLYGPSGTGKTLLAKAVAAESQAAFLPVEGDSFIRRYAGEGAAAIHELFAMARRYAPAVIFIDEIDAIGRQRTGEDSAGIGEICNALLSEMDGFSGYPGRPVFVLAATNYAVEPGSSRCLAPGLVRRFDRCLKLELPDCAQRRQFLEQLAGKRKLLELSQEGLIRLALRSHGMSLASLEAAAERAMRRALQENGKATDEMLEEVLRGGASEEKTGALLERAALHEAGHGLLSYQAGKAPAYLTIASRSGFGGYMQPQAGRRSVYTKQEAFLQLQCALGGRAAELVRYGEENGLSSGAAADLAVATQDCLKMLCCWGMGKTLGTVVMEPEKALAGPLGAAVLQEAKELLDEQMELAVAYLREHERALEALSQALAERGYLDGAAFAEILQSFS